MVRSKKELEGVPVIGNFDFGHINPMATFPKGGQLRFEAKQNDQISLESTKH
ncbi:hypothetical protein [Nafulsella turpanensis]|uniref:hypothetical protein n=1 Tax=Nafulsella turpanensis TaxID=1265690 RepID=UPI000346A21B